MDIDSIMKLVFRWSVSMICRRNAVMEIELGQYEYFERQIGEAKDLAA